MRTILLAALSFLAIAHAHAASFDCKAAHSPREQAICSDPKLSSLDEQLAAAYKNARTKLSSDSFALVQSDQRDWLRWLDKVCPPVNPSEDGVASCLTNHYSTRLKQLNEIQKIGDSVFYPRTHYVFVAGVKPQRDEPQSDNDPGFGYGEFAWPQIDKPNQEQAVWNTAIFNAATNVEETTLDEKAPNLDASVDAGGFNYGFYSLIAANGRLIDVDLGIMTYGYGAAHPNTVISSRLWWLNERRAVTADEVFLPNSGWRQKLIEPVIQKLHANLGENITWKGDGFRKAISVGLADAESWSLSDTGLTITYGQYAVAAYAYGMPSVTFTWSELNTYLNPTLHPETLPQLLKQTK